MNVKKGGLCFRRGGFVLCMYICFLSRGSSRPHQRVETIAVAYRREHKFCGEIFQSSLPASKREFSESFFMMHSMFLCVFKELKNLGVFFGHGSEAGCSECRERERGPQQKENVVRLAASSFSVMSSFMRNDSFFRGFGSELAAAVDFTGFFLQVCSCCRYVCVCVCVCVFCRIDLLRFFFSVSLSFFVENNPLRPGGEGVFSVFSDLTWCSIPGCFSYGTQ